MRSRDGDVFDRATADRMQKFILAPGNPTDRADPYRQFRGPDPDVLSARSGIPYVTLDEGRMG